MELWIARESDGDLYAYETKPSYDEIDDNWDGGGKWFYMDIHLFPEVTFENSPQKVKIELVKE